MQQAFIYSVFPFLVVNIVQKCRCYCLSGLELHSTLTTVVVGKTLGAQLQSLDEQYQQIGGPQALAVNGGEAIAATDIQYASWTP